MTTVVGLLRGWHFVDATVISPQKTVCQFAADDILLYEFCYYYPMDIYFTNQKEKKKKNYHHHKYLIKTLQISYEDITRRRYKEVKYTMVMKIYLRTITQYEEDKKEEASMGCSLLHSSWSQILYRCPHHRLQVESLNLKQTCTLDLQSHFGHFPSEF